MSRSAGKSHRKQILVTPPKQNQTKSVQFILCVFLIFSYRDYRSNEDYTLTSQFWFVLAMRFVFVILFEVRAPIAELLFIQIMSSQNFNDESFFCPFAARRGGV